MKNRHSIKKEQEAGSFTTVSYSILRDSNLTSVAKLLLVEILSDSDDMTLSPTLYANRMDLTIKTIYNALNCLIDNGYIRRKDISKANKNGVNTRPIYHYTISEFGNLKSKEETVSTTEIKKDVIEAGHGQPIVSDKPTKEQIDNFIIWIETLPTDKKNFLNTICDDKILSSYSEMKRIGKLVAAHKEESSDINTFLDSLLLDGTIAEKKAFKLRMIAATKGMTENEQVTFINKKRLYYNTDILEKINNKKEQSTLQ